MYICIINPGTQAESYSNRFVCVCVCVFLNNLCNGLLLKILGHCKGKSTLGLLRDSSDLQENSSMEKIQSCKVEK